MTSWSRQIAPAADREPDAVVADVATGTAAVAIALARRYPCRVVGIDQSPEMLAGGARRVEDAGLAAGSSSSRARPSGCRSRPARSTP